MYIQYVFIGLMNVLYNSEHWAFQKCIYTCKSDFVSLSCYYPSMKVPASPGMDGPARLAQQVEPKVAGSILRLSVNFSVKIDPGHCV